MIKIYFLFTGTESILSRYLIICNIKYLLKLFPKEKHNDQKKKKNNQIFLQSSYDLHRKICFLQSVHISYAIVPFFFLIYILRIIFIGIQYSNRKCIVSRLCIIITQKKQWSRIIHFLMQLIHFCPLRPYINIHI